MSLIYTQGLRSSPHSYNAATEVADVARPGKVNLGSWPPRDVDIVIDDDNSKRWQHLYVLPVLLFEFLALALTRAVLPSMLLHRYGNKVYLVMGFADCVRGLLAFVACPLFGKVSDIIGRRLCLFITVLGTCAPVSSLAFFPWEVTVVDTSYTVSSPSSSFNSTTTMPRDSATLNNASSVMETEAASDESGFWPIAWGTHSYHTEMSLPPSAITVFVVLLSLSGIFSSTFTLVFAYISDTVRHQDERVSAYGLALATFGLSFTIGPMAGGYLAQYNKQYVFFASLCLTVVDLVYIYLFLPESRDLKCTSTKGAVSSIVSNEYNISWNPWNTVRVVALDPFLRKVGEVAFLYYTGLWALISTLSVYAVKHFHLTPERLGELMSALGLCTMVAEAVLVRIVVPMFGEKRATRIGLLSFATQCIVLGLAFESWHLFVCAAFSLAGNLVYPSLSSLISGSVEPDAVGEALGAINGIKALTEGIGPLIFGSLMTLSEHSVVPGWPYLIAAVLAMAAYKAAGELPGENDDYIHELDQKQRYGKQETAGNSLQTFGKDPKDQEDEYVGLLSDVEESDVDKD